MPVRPDRNQIPTIRQGIDRFLLHCEAAGQKSLKDHISVLRGTNGRVTGQAAKGPALAQSELGGLRFDRATAEGFDRWFLSRVPVGLAPATRKRARSIQRQLVRYAIGQGWADERLLACCPTLPILSQGMAVPGRGGRAGAGAARRPHDRPLRTLPL